MCVGRGGGRITKNNNLILKYSSIRCILEGKKKKKKNKKNSITLKPKDSSIRSIWRRRRRGRRKEKWKGGKKDFFFFRTEGVSVAETDVKGQRWNLFPEFPVQNSKKYLLYYTSSLHEIARNYAITLDNRCQRRPPPPDAAVTLIFPPSSSWVCADNAVYRSAARQTHIKP